MKTTIEAVKRILDKYYPHADGDVRKNLTEMMKDYHSRKCLEAGRELKYGDKCYNCEGTGIILSGTIPNKCPACSGSRFVNVDGHALYKQASTLLAAKQGEIERLADGWKRCLETLDEVSNELVKCKQQLKSK